MKYYIITRRKLCLFLALLLIGTVIAGCLYFNKSSIHTAKLVMGAQLYSQEHQGDNETPSSAKASSEKYFRPSRLPVLNDKAMDADTKIPEASSANPEATIINYFSVIREAENLTEEKSGGCGTVGNAKLPFPIAYQFFTSDYQKNVDYVQYLKSFEGIGHTSLIKLNALPPDEIHPQDNRYFIELETIEGSDKNMTYFAYYFGFVYLQKQADKYLISDMQLLGEDFLCAPYHGWYHDAESNVSIRYGNWCNMIKKQYPVKQTGYTKKIYFEGMDGENYMIEFMNLTNGTDTEVAQYKQSIEGQWKVIYLNPEKCVEDKQ